MSLHRHTLLTGATGLIGRHWLKALLSGVDGRITVLGRRPVVCGDPRVRFVRADLAQAIDLPALPSVTDIIHCAAEIRFNLPIEQARAVNVGGTARILDVARGCPSLEKMAHVSTVFVAGCRPGRLPEGRLIDPAGFFNTYQQSKHEAEELVLAARGVPAVIYRLSSVIGHSVTGAVEQMNYFHQALRLVPRNPFPALPALPDARVDFIATDWAVATLHHLFERHFEAGAVFNVCAGASHSLTVREVIEAAFKRAGAPVPDLVSAEEFERSVANAGPSVRELLALTRYFLPHLSISQTFDNARTLAAADGAIPNSRMLLDRVLAALVRAGPL